MIKFYCEHCGIMQRIKKAYASTDDLNEVPWDDIVCNECHFVIATFESDKEGELVIKED